MKSELKPTVVLKKLMERDEILVIPGCYDALSAKIIEKVGFEAAYLSGFALEATLLGKPDVNLTTLTEIATTASHVTSAVKIPVIADAETGFGGPLQVARTVKEYERAGLAGLHIEDQRAPKKGGSIAGRDIIPAEEMVGKIKAALEARDDPDFLIIGRTDARDISFDEEVRRANLYAEAGADAILLFPQTSEEVTKLPKLVDASLIINVNEYREYTMLSVNELQELGWKMVWFILSELFVATRALTDLWTYLKKTGTTKGFRGSGEMASFKEVTDLVGLAETRDFEKRFSSKEEVEKRYARKQWGE